MFMNYNFDQHDIFEDIHGAIFTKDPVAVGIGASTRLATSAGHKAARDIEVGDQVMTFDNGLRSVLSVTKTLVPVRHDALPIFVPAGAIGNRVEFVVPELQVVMIESDRAEALFGDPFVLVRAGDLVGYNGICRTIPMKEMELVTIEFEADEVVFGSTGELFFCPVSHKTIQRSDSYAGRSSYAVLPSDLAARLTKRHISIQLHHSHEANLGADAYDLLHQDVCLAA